MANAESSSKGNDLLKEALSEVGYDYVLNLGGRRVVAMLTKGITIPSVGTGTRGGCIKKISEQCAKTRNETNNL
ncbi:MAG: hypothetical protein WCJ19_01230 [bacterium]